MSHCIISQWKNRRTLTMHNRIMLERVNKNLLPLYTRLELESTRTADNASIHTRFAQPLLFAVLPICCGARVYWATSIFDS